VNVFNVTGRQDVTSISPGKTATGDQYTFRAPRSFQVSACRRRAPDPGGFFIFPLHGCDK
jgi:hypothetical protein